MKYQRKPKCEVTMWYVSIGLLHLQMKWIWLQLDGPMICILEFHIALRDSKPFLAMAGWFR